MLNISIYTACSKVSVAIPIAVENAREEVGQCETRRWRWIPFTTALHFNSSLGTDHKRDERESGQSISCRVCTLSASTTVFRELRAPQSFRDPSSLPSQHIHIHEEWTILSLFLLAIQVFETRSSQSRAVRCSCVVGLSRIVVRRKGVFGFLFSIHFWL